MQFLNVSFVARLRWALRVSLTATLAAGWTAHAAPPTGTVEAYPSTITAGQTSLISFVMKGAAYVDITPDLGRFGASATAAASPVTTQTYTLTATALSGEAYTTTVTVTVLP